MENRSTPHIKRKLDGSIEIYKGLPSSEDISSSAQSILYLAFIVLVLSCFSCFLFALFAFTKNINYLAILFLVCSIFIYTFIHNKRKTTPPFIVLNSVHMKINNKDYLWQDIQEIYYYTIRGEQKMMFYFSKNKQVEKLEIDFLEETEKHILLDTIKGHKDIIENTPPAMTSIERKILPALVSIEQIIIKKIGKERWERLIGKNKRERLIQILFIIFCLIAFFCNIFEEKQHLK